MATTYQGPHVSVTQKFVTSPSAVAVESLPSAAVASAYNVHDKESLGTSYGILDREVLWGDDGVIFDGSVAGQKAFDFYPAVVYAQTTKSGNVNLDLTSADVSDTGATIDKDAMYDLTGTAKASGSCQAILPFYKFDAGTGKVNIFEDNSGVVVVTGGAVVTARLKPGMRVYIDDALVGIVGSIGNDETKINLQAPYTETNVPAAVVGDVIIVGASDDGAGAPTTYSEIFYDETADFGKVLPGDIVQYSSKSIAGSVAAPLKASVVSVLGKTSLRINTLNSVATAGHIDYNFSGYYPQQAVNAPQTTISVDSYVVKRLVGFSANLQLKTAPGVAVTKVSENSFTVLDAALPAGLIFRKGDVIAITDALTGTTTDERAVSGLTTYLVDTANSDGTTTTISTEDAILKDTGVTFVNGDFLCAWRPNLQSNIVADFRAVRSEENCVAKRIGSMQDIYTAWVSARETELKLISPYNELAYMMSTIFSMSGGKVCYGVNVNAAADNLSAEYATAFDALKMFDVYSHAIGTTDAGVNAIVGAYCDEQSAPYEAHERTAIICYDADDIYRVGTDTAGTIVETTGVITGITGIDVLHSGLTVGDKVTVKGTFSSVPFTTVATIVSTPDTAGKIVTDYRSATAPTIVSYTFSLGRLDAQAIALGAIKYGNRRVSAIFPGWFTAVYNNVQGIFPPYFISAAIAGMDSGVIASQSFTNRLFSIPGLSSINLGTSNIFRKSQLDEIGGGGIDIMIQDVTPSASIRSRHDLTTNMDAVQYRERSITKQADVAAKTLRAAVAPYVGKYNINDPSLFRFLGMVCSIVTNKLVDDGVVAAMNVDSITRDPVIDDKVNFSVSMTAFIAGNYYDITLLVKTR